MLQFSTFICHVWQIMWHNTWLTYANAAHVFISLSIEWHGKTHSDWVCLRVCIQIVCFSSTFSTMNRTHERARRWRQWQRKSNQNWWWKKRGVCSRRENPMLCVHVYLMFIASQCYTGGSLRHLGRCVPLDLVMVTMKMVIFKSQNFLTCHCHFLPDFN